MDIQDINLGFLWDKEVPILDGINPYDEKWMYEEHKYKLFIKNEPFEKVFALMIISFKDKFPREYYWYTSFYSSLKNDKAYEENGYECADGQYLRRKGLSKFSWKVCMNEDDLEYFGYFKYDFLEPLDLRAMIAENLEGKSYTKEEGPTATLYKLEDCPIAQIETSPTSFSLSINDAYFIEH